MSTTVSRAPSVGEGETMSVSALLVREVESTELQLIVKCADGHTEMLEREVNRHGALSYSF